MHLDQNRIDALAERIAESDLQDRHRERTRQEYKTIFDVDPQSEEARDNLDLIFRRVIQARATPLSRDQYLDVLNEVSLGEIIEEDDHETAFDALRSEQHIGQKIANELLRHVVDIFGHRRDEWGDQLYVALDTNVVQALVKTGAIVLEGDEQEREGNPGRIVNMNPDSDPRKLVGYRETQEALQEAAEKEGFPRIVFDELWLENREFFDDPLLEERSEFSDLLQ